MYNRASSVAYATKYALSPNPRYYFFDGLGGDCTNFVSQCLHAGGFGMVVSNDGWFYVSLDYRSPSWTGVEFFRSFLLSGKHPPKGRVVKREEVEVGDVVFLFDGERFYHTLIVTLIHGGEIFTSSHSYPSLNRSLATYPPNQEFVHIED